MNSMNISMMISRPPVAEDAVARLEGKLGSALPEAYRTFLRRYNGGRPEGGYFLVSGWPEERSLVNDFCGVQPGQYDDIEENIELLEGRLPAGFIPIADDPGGNLVLLSLRGETRGKVYFWDHENEPDNPSDDLRDYGNIFLVADNFGEFLSSLQGDDPLETSDA